MQPQQVQTLIQNKASETISNLLMTNSRDTTSTKTHHPATTIQGKRGALNSEWGNNQSHETQL